MRHAPATVVTLRPLDELEPVALPPARASARSAPRAPAGARSVLEMLDLALEVLRDRFALMVGLGALAWLPVRALQPFIGAHVWQSSMANGSMLGPSLGSLVNTGGSALAQCFGSALLARLVYDGLAGRESALLPALRAALARFHVVLGVALLTAVATAAGTCACFVPGILLSWKLAVAPMVCVIEDLGVGSSLQRSWLLTRRGFWRWVLLALCSTVIASPFSGIAVFTDFPGMRERALSFTGLSSGSFDALFVFVSSLVLGVVIALHAAIMTVYYADARVRREGADLEQDLARIRSAEARA
jgi:hypothetical protein